jgi:hypothetical protein
VVPVDLVDLQAELVVELGSLVEIQLKVLISCRILEQVLYRLWLLLVSRQASLVVMTATICHKAC